MIPSMTAFTDFVHRTAARQWPGLSAGAAFDPWQNAERSLQAQVEYDSILDVRFMDTWK